MVMKIFMIVCTLVVLSTGEPKPQYPGNYQYGKLSGGYQGPQQAVLYSINNDHYLLRLLQDMEKYEGNEVNYLVNSKIKDTIYGTYPSSSSSSSTSTTTTTASPEVEGETTPEGDATSSTSAPTSTTTAAPPSTTTAATTPKSNCEIVIGKNGYVSSKVAYYQYPTGNYKPPVMGYPGAVYPAQPPVMYGRY
ncbi:hypothetical protein ACFFRR_005190 [Megaselia abdita]